MLESISKLKTHHQIIFTILIAFAVVSFWRGVWGLMDLYFFPHNMQLSVWLSVVLGLSVLIVTGYAVKELM